MEIKDKDYWLQKEEDIQTELISLRDYDLIFYEKKRNYADLRYLIRKGVAKALLQARKYLPKGYNFKVYDGWRSWELQEICAKWFEGNIRKAHPTWSEAQIKKELWKLAPPQRVFPDLGSHRYGGAIDLNIVDNEGKELNMGVPVDYAKGEEARLLYYEKDNLTPKEIEYRNNRRLLIKVMEKTGFHPYLAEWWHWSFKNDIKF